MDSRIARCLALLGVIALLGATSTEPARADSFVTFETGQVRPLALSPDQTHLFAINTPDNRLEIFDVGPAGLTHTGSVVVGMEPIAVAARSDSEVWVVNHLSDSISIVDVASVPPRIVRTLNTCDEPRDIVFAGPGGNRAFVTTARRGQNCPVNADSTVPGTGRAIVQVWDATNLGAGLNGTPVANVVLFGDTPRALARSADGSTVYAAIFHSGNQTTSILETLVCDGGASAGPCTPSGANAPGGLPAPNDDANGELGPETGLIVKFNRTTNLWEDNIGRDWTNVVRFDLPDLDVFKIDAAAAVPAETANFAHVGTILFNMVTNPVSGKVYVSNTEARNEVRFEGPGTGATTVQGHLHEARVTVLDGANVNARHLNKHIDYNVRPAPPGVATNSLATPVGMAITSDGATLYVAAFGSSKVGIFDTAQLENDTFVPTSANHIPLSGGGPTGLLLDEANNRLYVFTRFDNSVSVVDLASKTELDHVALYNPEPAKVVDGRPFLYDANFTSSNGEASCSSCHIFGDFDSLGWDLGNPDDVVATNPIPTRIPPIGITPDFHPLKGPMTTQSLRGMANHGSMHWRGDRNGGPGNPFDEVAAFNAFNVAFPGLIGRSSQLSAADMQAFADFILEVTYPPNPIRNLNNTLTTAEQAGHDLFFGRITDTVFNCSGCHHLDPTVNAMPDGSFSPQTGFFGSDGFTTFEGEPQMFKVAHLRNVYQKIGMFGVAPAANTLSQMRGFGVLHDGAVDTVFDFLSAGVFSLSNQEQNQLQRFVFAFDSNLAPMVGQQVTLSSTVNTTNANNRVNNMLARSDAGECDIIVTTVISGEQRGGLRLPDGTFQLDREDDPTLTDAELRAMAIVAGGEVTYSCVPRGSGQRIALDRDQDGFFDHDEIDEGTNPADPGDFPVVPIGVRANTFTVNDDATPPINPNQSRLSFRSAKVQGSPSGVVVPAPGSNGDPTTAGATGGGATLTIYRADGGTDKVVLSLPAANWKRTGPPTKPGYQYTDNKRLAGPINSASLREEGLTIRGFGVGMYQLDNAPQNSMALRLRLGGEVEFCATAPAKTPVTTNDTTSKFQGQQNAPAPAECPDVP